jgi:hypothetical protein
MDIGRRRDYRIEGVEPRMLRARDREPAGR